MKNIRTFAWISAGIGVIILVIGIISFLTGKQILNVSHNVSYLHAANSFLLLTIALFIASKQCCCNKCDCEDEKKAS